MNLKVVGGLVGLILVAGGALGLKMAVDAQRPKGSDQEQIQTMLMDGEKAAKRKDAAGINRFISRDYSDGLGMTDTSLKYQVNDYLRRKSSFDITVPLESTQVMINPDGRTGTAQFIVRVNAENSASFPMTLKLVKEPVHYFLFFPGEEWKVISAEGYAGLEGVGG